MPGVPEFLTAWAAAESGLTSLLGSGSNMRWAPHRATQGVAFPRVVYTLIDGTADRTLMGPTGLNREVWQIDSQATTYDGALEVARAVEELAGYRGTLAGVFVQGAHLETRLAFFEPSGRNDDGGVFRELRDFILWWEEA